jgi:CxxC-x17-CxxC domain-containing protein
MEERHPLEISIDGPPPIDEQDEFSDVSIPCIDCGDLFTWTAGEQAFYRDKDLRNPPKRCRPCKRAKNLRLEAIENARATGQRHKIEVKAQCATCFKMTTVPFYPSQGRPVYCRSCFLEINTNSPAVAGAA